MKSCSLSFIVVLKTKAQQTDQYGNQDDSIGHIFICLPAVNATETTLQERQ